MKTLLCLSVASMAALGLASRELARFSEATKDLPPDALELGIKAITGQLTESRLAELGLQAPEARRRLPLLSDLTPDPILSLPPAPQIAPMRLETPPLTILEAWGDASGVVFARMTDGQTYRLLASGDWVLVSTVHKTHP